MKSLKILFAVVLMAGSTSVFAQHEEGKRWDAESRSQHEIERISEAVPNLSEDQKKKLKDVSMKHFEAMKEVREERKEEHEQMREKRQEMMKEKLTTYKAVLSQEQYIQLLEYMVTYPKKGGHHGGRKHGGHKGPRGEGEGRR